MKVHSKSVKLLGDLTTPVSLFLKIREAHHQVLLLESSDYSSREDSLSFIVFNPLSTLTVQDGVLSVNGNLSTDFDLYDEMQRFMDEITITGTHEASKYQALVGYTGFNAIRYFETIQLDNSKNEDGIPDLRYDFYRNMIVIDHFYEELYLVDNTPEGDQDNLEELKTILYRQDHQTFRFRTTGEDSSNMSDEAYMDMVSRGKAHCQRGDVFQIVLSRRYYTPFKGDDFNVYRALRSINPSPYLFYFDYGSFRIFGSSPEAQLIVQDGLAEIHPIAGTFRRTGNYIEDQALAQRLAVDPKESSEHVMLVDLARNDLSRNCTKVKVESFKEIQFFSHVIHLVSKVTGKVKYESTTFEVYGDTFPAGTLSGAPKFKAMQLIDRYEPNSRSFYGGGIGLIMFNGNLLHAIIIRSFLSQSGKLTRQAGAGIVIKSDEASELQEVNNKLAALKNAITLAEKL